MNRSGFSLIEVMIGMLIFVMGVMALAASTGFVSMQLLASDIRTERNVAYQQATEQLHALHFDSVKTRASADATTIGAYSVWWDVTSLRWALKEVDIYSEGPGFQGGDRVSSLTDTLTIRIARSVK
ncbi:MAG TPA: prepilin-type N-terminal cleavage/methylation domain-containing protein [Longimicrobiales bacterium]|nr:prepilin-type N-terminal cleavage/methylation domain-containing protein [Longimicrobiales bacterium]